MNEFETLKTELQKNNEDNCEKLIEQTKDLKNILEEQNNKIEEIYKTGLLYFHAPTMNIDDKIIGTLDKNPIMDAMMENLKLIGKNKIDYVAIILKYYCYNSVNLQESGKSGIKTLL